MLEETKVAKLAKFYLKLSQILDLEWFLLQLPLSPRQSLAFEQAMNSGLQFFQDDQFTQRLKRESQTSQKPAKGNERAHNFLTDLVLTQEAKREVRYQV